MNNQLPVNETKEKSFIIGGENRIYWLILVLVAIGVAAGVIWMTRTTYEEVPLVIPEEKQIEAKLKIGVGYSINSQDLKTAVQETYTKMTEQLEGEKPVFAILFSTVGYDQEQILKEINLLMPGTKIYGYTSTIGTMTNEGFHIGQEVTEGYTLGLMGFASSEMTFGVGVASLDEASSTFEVAKTAITRGIKDAGKSKDDKPKIVLITSAPFGIGEESVIAGLESVIGKEVPITGGVAGKKIDFSGGEAMFANNKVYFNGVVAVPIYTDLKIGHIFLTGFNDTGKKGVVTKFKKDATGLHIVEIDHQPAAKVYNNWLDGLLDNYFGITDWFITTSLFHPLAKKLTEVGGFVNWQIVAPIHFNPDDSLTVGAMVEEGNELYLLEGNQKAFIDRIPLTVRLARSQGRITEKEIAGVVMDQCMTALIGTSGPDDWNSMAFSVDQAAGGAPFLGASSIGPYGYFLGNRYTEITVSAIIFSKD